MYLYLKEPPERKLVPKAKLPNGLIEKFSTSWLQKLKFQIRNWIFFNWDSVHKAKQPLQGMNLQEKE